MDDQSDFRKPVHFVSLISLGLAQRESLKGIVTRFIEHRAHVTSIRGSRKILEDQWELFRLEQELFDGRVTDDDFGQRSFDALERVFGLRKLQAETREKVESVAQLLRDARSAFIQRIGFWVTVIFAPFAITASFFSGTHMEKAFAATHHTFFGTGSPFAERYAGWIQFFIVFCIVSLAVGFAWLLARWITHRENLLAHLSSRNPRSRRRDRKP